MCDVGFSFTHSAFSSIVISTETTDDELLLCTFQFIISLRLLYIYMSEFVVHPHAIYYDF